MALSMDEQRILAEIEQHLAEAEPGLAARLSAFGRARPTRARHTQAGQRSLRAWPGRPPLLVTIAAAITMAAVALVVYALVALRGNQSPGGAGRPPSVPRAPAMAPRTSSSQAGAGAAQQSP